jgi:xanthosine utilization system XapX-like protein
MVVLSRLLVFLALTAGLIVLRWPLMQTRIRKSPVITTMIALVGVIVTITSFRWPAKRVKENAMRWQATPGGTRRLVGGLRRNRSLRHSIFAA